MSKFWLKNSGRGFRKLPVQFVLELVEFMQKKEKNISFSINKSKCFTKVLPYNMENYRQLLVYLEIMEKQRHPVATFWIAAIFHLCTPPSTELAREIIDFSF